MKLVDMSVGEFLRELGSASPAPGGGSAAALCGALGAALCAMVARMTEGKEKLRGSWSDMERVRREAGALEARLRGLIDEDTEAFMAVMAARKLPRTSSQERGARAEALQRALLLSARVPLSILASIRSLSTLAGIAVERGNPACITDGGTAAEMLRAAAVAAAWNVRVNLVSIGDAGIREELRCQAAADLRAVLDEVRRIEQLVDERLGGPAAGR